jgi:hypothetical protein
VVPEFDLGGCWPLWGQFAPDEGKYRCKRTWTTDPAYRDPEHPRRYVEKPPVGTVPMACWRTCWTPSGGHGGEDGGEEAAKAHCTAPCDPSRMMMPSAWRAEWNRRLSAWKASAEGQRWRAAAEPFDVDARGSWHSTYLTRQVLRVF